MKPAITAIVTATVLLLSAGSAFPLQTKKTQSSAKASRPRAPAAVGTTGAPSSVQRQLQRNPNLANQLTERLPRSFDAVSASSGFRTLGDFVAAINAANNLQIPFVTLKARMVDGRMSLGQAIRNLRPSADYRAEARRAEREAAAIIRK
jgi:hypothetical protein